jgi:hypothetical protein
VEKTTIVKNARESIHHAVVSVNHLQPEGVHAVICAEESMRADINFLAPKFDSARQAAYLWT